MYKTPILEEHPPAKNEYTPRPVLFHCVDNPLETYLPLPQTFTQIYIPLDPISGQYTYTPDNFSIFTNRIAESYSPYTIQLIQTLYRYIHNELGVTDKVFTAHSAETLALLVQHIPQWRRLDTAKTLIDLCRSADQAGIREQLRYSPLVLAFMHALKSKDTFSAFIEKNFGETEPVWPPGYLFLPSRARNSNAHGNLFELLLEDAKKVSQAQIETSIHGEYVDWLVDKILFRELEGEEYDIFARRLIGPCAQYARQIVKTLSHSYAYHFKRAYKGTTPLEESEDYQMIRRILSGFIKAVLAGNDGFAEYMMAPMPQGIVRRQLSNQYVIRDLSSGIFGLHYLMELLPDKYRTSYPYYFNILSMEYISQMRACFFQKKYTDLPIMPLVQSILDGDWQKGTDYDDVHTFCEDLVEFSRSLMSEPISLSGFEELFWLFTRRSYAKTTAKELIQRYYLSIKPSLFHRHIRIQIPTYEGETLAIKVPLSRHTARSEEFHGTLQFMHHT